MITIASADTEVALEIGSAIEGMRSYIIAARDEKNFRHQVHRSQPQVLVMDARLGGNAFEAVHGLPKISENVKSRPLTIVLLPEDSEAARIAAIELGAYEVITLSDPSWRENLLAAVTDAWERRLAGVLPDFSRPDGATLH